MAAQPTFVASGAGISGTTSLVAAYPAGLAPGDLLVLHVVNKYPGATPTTPSGWTVVGQTSGGSGAAGADSGSVVVSVFTRIADGSETGTLTVAVPGANSSRARMHAYRLPGAPSGGVAYGSGVYGASSYAVGGQVWKTGGTAAAASAPGVSWGVSSEPIDLDSNTLLLALSGQNSDVGDVSAESVAATGFLFGAAVERDDAHWVDGDDASAWMSEHPVTTGSGFGSPSYTATLSASAGAASPAGATVFLALAPTAAPAIRLHYSTLSPQPRAFIHFHYASIVAGAASRVRLHYSTLATTPGATLPTILLHYARLRTSPPANPTVRLRYADLTVGTGAGADTPWKLALGGGWSPVLIRGALSGQWV